MAYVEQTDDFPPIREIVQFDAQSGNLIERLVFNNRGAIFVVFLVITVVLGWIAATRLQMLGSFEKMLPKDHPYVQNYMANAEFLRGLGNVLRVAVETDDESIFNPEFLKTFQEISNEVFYTPGVARESMKSLWTPNTRYRVVTEEGFEGGPVIPPDYDGSPASIALVKLNVERAGLVGNLVANDLRSAAILVPIAQTDAETGERLNLFEFSQRLEEIRERFQRDGIRIHITGFAKIVGDLVEGLVAVMMFFGVAVVISVALLYWYTRCWRSTLIVLGVTIAAVIWQLGLLTAFGFELDPYSILVPFLVFAIGISHGAQKLNGVLQDIGRGCHKYVAARYTFRRLFLAGFTALAADGVGFLVLLIITIPVIQDLAITASIGVSVLIFTNLIMIPVALSYLGVTTSAAARAVRHEQESHGELRGLWAFLLRFTRRPWATAAIVTAAALTVGAVFVAEDLQIGDLDPGAPELLPDSRYNRDVKFMIEHYSVSSDIFAVIVKTPQDGCTNYEALSLADELEWRLRQLPEVEDVVGMNTGTRQLLAGLNEGYIKWRSLNRNQSSINYAAVELVDQRLVNPECSLSPLLVYLSDHKAKTLQSVVDTLAEFNAEWSSDEVQFLGAAGNAGFEAATNIVVKKANREMMIYVYAAVIVLSFITFRSFAGVLCAVIPLMVTSVLCEALMVVLGIGVKVATLPVIALGVGIGIDYALYVLTVTLAKTRQGLPLEKAYAAALAFTGRVVALVGVTLASGVVAWAFSPIKFQADMGILLTFMFLWNMVGALVLMPALAHFLLPKPKEVAAHA